MADLMIPRESLPYQGLVCMYMSNLGLTLEQAQARADERWRKQ